MLCCLLLGSMKLPTAILSLMSALKPPIYDRSMTAFVSRFRTRPATSTLTSTEPLTTTLQPPLEVFAPAMSGYLRVAALITSMRPEGGGLLGRQAEADHDGDHDYLPLDGAPAVTRVGRNRGEKRALAARSRSRTPPLPAAAPTSSSPAPPAPWKALLDAANRHGRLDGKALER